MGGREGGMGVSESTRVEGGRIKRRVRERDKKVGGG